MLKSEVLNCLYYSPYIVRYVKSRMMWEGPLARMEVRIGTYRVLVGKNEKM